MPLKSTPDQIFATVGVSKTFHTTIRKLAAIEETKMWILLDEMVLPTLQKRLARLTGKLSK